MVRLGIKFVKCVFDSLRPGQSQRQLRDGIIHLLLDGSEIQEQDSYESKYEELPNAICSCTRIDALLAEYKFTFSNSKAKKC